jgi:beta-glucosidase
MLAIGVAATSTTDAQGQDTTHDERARETEQRMTDDERFSLIISLLGPASLVPRDPRIPADVEECERGLYVWRPAARHPGAAVERR